MSSIKGFPANVEIFCTPYPLSRFVRSQQGEVPPRRDIIHGRPLIFARQRKGAPERPLRVNQIKFWEATISLHE